MKAFKKLQCWWLGCDPDYQALAYGDNVAPCLRCGAPDTSYEDQVGYSRHTELMEWCHYWLYRRWWPAKCPECGRRWECDSSVDHLPF